MQCVFTESARSQWVSDKTNSHKTSTDVVTHQQMPHFTCFISLITHLAVVNIASQQQWRPYLLWCPGWSLLWIYEVCGNDPGFFYSSLIFSLKCTTNTDTSGQKTARLNHGPTPALSNWLSSIHVCFRGNFLNTDGLHTLYCTISHINKVCVSEMKKIYQILCLHTCVHIE